MRGSDAYADQAELKLINRSIYHRFVLDFIDFFFSSLIAAPLVVSYWRGTWNLSDVYLLPNTQIRSSVASLMIGIVGHLVFTTGQGLFRDHFNPDRRRLTFYLISRLYTYVYGIVCVNCWRGGWQLIDHYTARDMKSILFITITAIIALMTLKTLRNVTATPFVVVTDHSREYFDVPTMYKKSGVREPGLYILDCLFSVLVIGSLVVFVWRGLWVLLDLKLFPEDQKTSAWASLIIGYAIVGLTFSLQPVMRWACEKLEGFWRIIVADVFLFVSFVGTVNVWRGIWVLLDCYFLPNNKLLSDWLTHGVSLILLILLNCSNSVLVRGVYIDAEEPAGQCVIFPVYYIRLFFQKERTKKQKRLMEKLEKVDQNNTILLIEKPQMNHKTTNDEKEIHESLCISTEDISRNEE
ncbi:CLUMA_CG007896, isoform C [Clunio marinus]|uniref:CLUMA_CG007896, isoform C n=1 Tax=Clunio marinus TaxID=568069 RepID=A0A1J1I465_9DIPT|nr:CLUMA_CG007896, isoform C [Clunio marinus]